jgi:hypothetical protein
VKLLRSIRTNNASYEDTLDFPHKKIKVLFTNKRWEILKSPTFLGPTENPDQRLITISASLRTENLLSFPLPLLELSPF